MAEYVNKQTLNDALIDYKRQCREAEDQGLPRPIPSDYIGYAILRIARGVAQKHNFRGYTWLDDMIGDGVVAAVNAIPKYDPERETQSGQPNPYGFFTQIIYWAFQARIVSEQKQNETKMAYLREVSTQLHIDGVDGVTHTINKEGIIEFLDAGKHDSKHDEG